MLNWNYNPDEAPVGCDLLITDGWGCLRIARRIEDEWEADGLHGVVFDVIAFAVVEPADRLRSLIRNANWIAYE